MQTGLFAFLAFVGAFIARIVASGFSWKDWVLWAIVGWALMTFAPVIALVQRRQPARTE